MTTTDVLAQARAALDGTTEGPWRIDPHDETSLDSIVSTADDRLGGWVEVARSLDADAAFIAWARDGVPDLIAEVERLRAQIAAVQALHHMDSYGDCAECPVPYDFGPNIPWPCPTILALDGETTSD